ncbi:MAG TPA: 6-hydroxymethylpterin diphosphokinase MptE-like protein [Chlamydiales bacterium]|nr:6-hydroxymethylpterin diphosphokinase MptE-like protein [Chlamydiales bacterium]
MSIIETLEKRCIVLCVYGASVPFYLEARAWLDEEASRRLIFIDEEPLEECEDAVVLRNDLRVKLHYLDSPLQIEPVAKKVAWSAVFQEMAFAVSREGRYTAAFQKELERCHLACGLILSEAADYGVAATKNAKANQRKGIRCGLGLKGKFQDVPAVIVGAGPSLEKNGRLIKEFPGLIFAGGTALNLLDTEPHFAASIDKEAPPIPRLKVPFCFQSRINPENFSRAQGPMLLFPDSSAPWINWINRQKEGFEMGWTVGNFLTGLALFLGCNPIVFVGMDFCYTDAKKYAHLKTEMPSSLIQVGDLMTQRDWMMAAQWTEELAAKNPQTKFIQATEGGLPLKEPILTRKFSKLLPGKEEDLRPRVKAEIEALAQVKPGRWKEWKKMAHPLLLEPLWSIWKPVFERELELDPHPDKLELNQALFFEQVIQEHLDA